MCDQGANVPNRREVNRQTRPAVLRMEQQVLPQCDQLRANGWEKYPVLISEMQAGNGSKFFFRQPPVHLHWFQCLRVKWTPPASSRCPSLRLVKKFADSFR